SEASDCAVISSAFINAGIDSTKCCSGDKTGFTNVTCNANNRVISISIFQGGGFLPDNIDVLTELAVIQLGTQYNNCPQPAATTNGNGGTGVAPATGAGSGSTTNSAAQSNPSTTPGGSNNSSSSSSSSNPMLYIGAGAGAVIIIGALIAGFIFYKRRKAATAEESGSSSAKFDAKLNGGFNANGGGNGGNNMSNLVGNGAMGNGVGVENHPWAGAAAVVDKSQGPGTLFGNMQVGGPVVAVRQEKEPFLGYPAAGYGQQQQYFNPQFQPPVPQAPDYGNNVPIIPTTTATASTFNTTSFPHDRKYNPSTFPAQSSSDYPTWDTNNPNTSTSSSSFNIESEMTNKYGYFTTWTHEIILSWAQNRLGDDALTFVTGNRVDGRLLNDVLNDSSLLSSVYGVGSARVRNEILSKAGMLRGVAGGSGAGVGGGRFAGVSDEAAPPPNYFDHAIVG
ncbi:hypothetical protein HDU76_005303, partial [Blyttiomyces sp. JEL0837]